MRNKILELITTKPKHFAKMIKSDLTMASWISEHATVTSDNYSEVIYSAIYGCQNTCKYGNTKKFVSINTGYSNCGAANKCQCTKESVSAKSQAMWDNRSAEETAEIRARADATNLEKYGVANAGQTATAIANHNKHYGKPANAPVIKKIIPVKPVIIDDGTIKTKITEHIEKFPLHYSRMLAKDTEVVEWVNANNKIDTTNFSEMIYSALNGINNISCKYGNQKKFDGQANGFSKLCGWAKDCQCMRELTAENSKKMWDNRTEDDRDAIKAKMDATSNEKFKSLPVSDITLTPSERIKWAIDNHPSNYGNMIRVNTDLVEWIENNTMVQSDSFAEKVYSALNNVSNQCKNGNTRLFVNAVEGYGMCRSSGDCRCLSEKLTTTVSGAITLNKKNASDDAPCSTEEAKQWINEIYTKNGDTVPVASILQYKGLYSHLNLIIKMLQLKHISEAAYRVVNDTTTNDCSCGKGKLSFLSFGIGYNKYCSRSCPSIPLMRKAIAKKKWYELDVDLYERAKSIAIEVHGTEDIGMSEINWEKNKLVHMEKHGVAFPSSRPDVREKVRQTNLARYGDANYAMTVARKTFIESNDGKNPFQIDEINEKIKATNLERYGYERALQSPTILSSMYASNLEKFGRTHASQLVYSDDLYDILMNKDRFVEIANQLSLAEFARDYDTNRDTILKYQAIHELTIYPVKKRSSYEEEMAQTFKKHNIEYLPNTYKLLNPLQVDFLFEKYSIAVEFNGLYWHGETHAKKATGYHASKYQNAKSKGVKLITIYEDEWWDRGGNIEHRLLKLLGVGSDISIENAVVQEIDKDAVINFCNQHHVHGYTDSDAVSYGVLINNILYAVISIDIDGMISNFCTLVGLNEKDAFIQFITISGHSSYTFIDNNRWTISNILEDIGFVATCSLLPVGEWTNYKVRWLDEDNELPKKDRIWDCGHTVYELK